MMADILENLTASERRALRGLAADAGVETEAMVPAILSAYLRLYRDAPTALGSDPLHGLRLRGRT